MVKIGIIGTGFVGLTHAAVTSRFGHNVIAYDINEEKIKDFSSGKKVSIEKHVNEKGLAALVEKQLKDKNLHFTTNPQDLSKTNIFFMCLPTPYKSNGESNLKYLFDAATILCYTLRNNNNFKLFINKSTVPIGTAKNLYKFLNDNGLSNFDTASNPEFLPEGEAVKFSISPEKIVVGSYNQKSLDILRHIYSSFYNNPNTKYIECENAETAEAIKYASNTLLYSQIVAWQAIPGTICETLPGICFDTLREGIVADSRIAKWGSYISAGVGGSCFKKDVFSIAQQLERFGGDARYMRLINDINEHHKEYLIERAEKEANFSFKGKKITILGASFKQGTNDIRESNILKMVPILLDKGVRHISIYDPLAIENTKEYFNTNNNLMTHKLSYHKNIIDSTKNSNATIIATDHQEFKMLNKILDYNISTPHLLIDGRRMISKSDISSLVNEKGISYLPIGGRYVVGSFSRNL